MRDKHTPDRPLSTCIGSDRPGTSALGHLHLNRAKPTVHQHWHKLQRRAIGLLAPSLLLAGQLWLGARPAQAQAQTAPGTTIDNTATGSFVDTSTGNTTNIVSNTVTVTVLEVAGIGVTAQTPVEATVAEAEVLLAGSAGSYQALAGVHTGDVIYFDFVIENLGNDPTAFVIPNAPSSVIGGTFITGSLQIIAVDPDGAGADYPTIVDFDSGTAGDQPFTVSTTDDTFTLLGSPNGYIPPGGTVTVRVPIEVTETTVGNSVSVVLGETVAVGDQNQVYSANTNDLYTEDLADGTTNPYTTPATTPEAAGTPVAEKEASAQETVNLAAAYQLTGYKSVLLTNDANSDGKINEGETVTWTVTYVNTGTGTITDVQITDDFAAQDLIYVASSLAVATGNTTTFPNPLNSSVAPTLNLTYDGDTTVGATTDDEFFTGTLPTLAPGEILQITFETTIDDTTDSLPRTEQNQATANGNNSESTPSAITPVNTDNIDTTTTGLPNNVTVPAGSVTQTQVATSIDPTTLTVTAPGATSPDLLLIKRITALIPGNGDPIQNFTGFVDDGEDNNADSVVDNSDPGWPSNYIQGVLGLTNTNGDQLVEASPGDIVEYTIYFLNTGDGPATNVNFCDRLSPYLTYVPTTYGTAPDLGMRLVFGSDADIRNLTGVNDGDLGQFVSAGVDLTGTCKFLNDKGTATTTDDTVDDLGSAQNINGVVLVTPTSGTSPTQLDPATGSGTPSTAYGYIRFRATVK